MNDHLIRTLHQQVLARDEIADLDGAARRAALREIVEAEVPSAYAQDLFDRLWDEIEEFGRLSGLMRDPLVTDVIVNGPTEVWVERAGELERAPVSFPDRSELEELVQRLVGRSGGRVDPSRPIGDVRLKDGSRMHVVAPPVAPNGPLVTIRRFATRPLSLAELEARGALEASQRELLIRAVHDRESIVIAGATGAGKTTLLGALLAEVPASERIVVIEESPELNPAHEHWVSLLVRNANPDGTGAIDQAELLRAALRMRPDRLVVGEVRGAESLVAIDSMSTGHRGSMLSVHASSPRGAEERLLSLAMQNRGGPSESAIRGSLREAVDIYIQLEKAPSGRRIAEIWRP